MVSGTSHSGAGADRRARIRAVGDRGVVEKLGAPGPAPLQSTNGVTLESTV